MNMDTKNKKALWQNQQGMGTVEVILIIVVLISLVIIFRSQIIDFVNTIFGNITKTASTFDPTT